MIQRRVLPLMKPALDVVSGMLLITGVALWVYEAPIPQSPARTPLSGSSSSLAGPRAQLTELAGPVVANNIFSNTRAAPSRRYTLSDGTAGGEAVAAPERYEAAVLPPAVYGTMTGPAGSVALIQPDSAGASGRLFREGERVGEFRIEKILENSVVFRSRAGRIEVRVESRDGRAP